MTKKTKYLLFFLLFVFFFCLSSTKVFADTVYLEAKGQITYGDWGTTYFYAGSDEVNAYCLQPHRGTPDDRNYSYTEITHPLIVKAMWFAWGAPGWDDAKNHTKNVFCAGGCSDEESYAWVHIALSMYYEKYYLGLSSNEWATGMNYEGALAAVESWRTNFLGVNTDGSPIEPAYGVQGLFRVPSSFHVYLIDTGNSLQNIGFWRYSPQGGLKVTKSSPDDTSKKFLIEIVNSTGTVVRSGRIGHGESLCYGYTNNDNCSGDYNLNPGSEYTVREVLEGDEAHKWIATGNNVHVTIPSNSTVTKTITNNKKDYCITVTKKDAETNSTLSNFKYTLKKGSTTIGTCTTGSNGKCTFNGLEYADYTIEESTSDSDHWIYVGTKNVSKSDLDAAQCNDITFTNYKKYYCLMVKKVDAATGQPVPGAEFEVKKGNTVKATITSGSDGLAAYFTGTDSGNYTVTETKAPPGFALPSNATVTVQPKLINRIFAGESTSRTECNNKTANDANGNPIQASAIVYEDSKLLMNWYKTTEDGDTPVNGAKFTVKKGSTTLKFKAKSSVTDSTGNDTRNCYVYDTSGTITELVASTVADNHVGEVCISGIPEGTYTVTETVPAKYHTFDSTTTKSISVTSTSTKFATKKAANKFINYPTEFEFTKTVTSGDEANKKVTLKFSDGTTREVSYKDLTTDQLKKIKFYVYESTNATTPLHFYKTDEGEYEYAGNTIDKPSGLSEIKTLHLNDSRKIKIYHLEAGKTYYIKEVNSSTCDSSVDNDQCIGYYYPKYTNSSSYSFVINNTYNSVATQSLSNTPTEIKFTKSDLYTTYGRSDNVKFENDEERSAYDQITFKMIGPSGNYLRLIKVGDTGTCKDDNSYSEYRFVPQDMITNATNATEELHTCGGHIKITNLCRGYTYKIVETSVPENSVFVLPGDNPEVSYDITCTGDSNTNAVTKEIVNTPTRVVFQKRDSQYGHLINDETTTFNVYQCKSNVEKCIPSVGRLLKFEAQNVINNDDEDYGKKVYRFKETSTVSDIHPYKGDIIFRYLPTGYKYVLVETVAPKGYSLPKGENAYTYFTINSTTVDVEEVDVPNKPTSLIIKKYDQDGNLLPGAKFRIHKVISYDENRTPENQTKETLRLKTIRNGMYDAREVTDTDTVITCKDTEAQKCSDISSTLTYDGFVHTWTNFSTSLNQNGERVQITEGEALIQYIEYNTYYVIEEVEAPKGYSLPEKSEDRFYLVYIDQQTDVLDTQKQFVNKPTPFTFYKFDEYNNPLDGGKFKLQKLDQDKKYQDIPLTLEEIDGKYFYKVDNTSQNYFIDTKNGEATVYYLEEGQYRILEVQAPPGKELPKKSVNVATFFVDSVGNVYGNSIITNKSKTETNTYYPEAKAELIVNVQTGQERIKYGLIIALIILFISGLIYIQKKRKK